MTSVFSKPTARTLVLEDIVGQVLQGLVRVPNFQRGLRWQFKDVQRLFDSIRNGYPIGSLLLWTRRAKRKQRIHLGALSIVAPAGEAMWIVDGQQRVTSLANALTEDGHHDPRFALAFDLKKDDFTKPGAASHVIPLPVLFDLQRLLKWFSDHPDLGGENLVSATAVAKAIREFTIPAYIVTEQDEAKLRDIFDRMNNYGRRLSRAEVFSALHAADQAEAEAKKGVAIKLESVSPNVNQRTHFGRIDDDTILRAVLARRGANVTREVRDEFRKGIVRDVPVESPGDAYRAGEEAIVQAIEFLQQEAAVPHFSFLPYRYLLVVLSRFFAHFPKPKPRNVQRLRRWFWRAVLAGPNVSKGSWTGAMRFLSTQIKAGEESASLERLLKALEPVHKNAPQILRFRTNQADSRILLCALWSIDPRSPLTGEIYDRSMLSSRLDEADSARDALFPFFEDAPATRRVLASNWTIAFEEEGIGEAWPNRPEAIDKGVWRLVLRSHALEGRLIRAYRGKDSEAFFKERQERLNALLRDFITQMTESEFEDTPPLDELSIDEAAEEPMRDDMMEPADAEV